MAKASTIINDISEEVLDLRQIRPYLVSNINYQIEQSRQGEEPSPPVLWGPPGIGKSFFLEDICRENRFGLVTLYLSNVLIHQLTGLPMVKMDNQKSGDERFVPWSWPDIFDLSNMKVHPTNEDGSKMTAKQIQEKAPPIVMFLDDIHLCGPDIQKFLFQLLTQKAINKHKLPSNIVLALAGNRAEDHAGFRQMNSGISSRLTHYDVKGDPEVWVNDYAIPQGIGTDIVSWIQFKPSNLNGTPMENQAWANPRTWSEASRQVDALRKVIEREPTSDEMFPIVKAKVGKAHAVEFYNYRELLMKWKPHRILNKQCTIHKGTGTTTENDIYLSSLDKISAYALLTSIVGEIQKVLRKADYKVTKETNALMEFVKENIMGPLTSKHRVIVPLAIKMLIIEETSHRKNATLVKKLLTDESIVKELMAIM